MNTIESIASRAYPESANSQKDTQTALRFITCGSVDDGKSTLIGRLLVDSKAVLQDHLAGVTRGGEADLALLTDGLQAEREQGITIDVAYRYFNTESRKFIIGDAPGHEQYTRNMVTAASQADAAVVLVDATKLDWQNAQLPLLPQTRRHALLLKLLRVPSVVFAINKLDAVAQPELAYQHIRGALQAFTASAGMAPAAIVPVSALKGWNVVDFGHEQAGWCGYSGPTLLEILERLPVTPRETALPLAFPVQWVEKFSSSSDTSQGRRVFWGRVATGHIAPGTPVQVLPGGQQAEVAQVLDHARRPGGIGAGHSAGVVLDREVDVSRGDWIVAAPAASDAADDDFDTPASAPAWPPVRELSATVAWMDDEPLVAGRVYWALHGHRWVKAKVRRVVHRLDIHTLAEEAATQLEPNAIGHVELVLQEPIPATPFARSRVLGSLILVDTASHKTAGAVLIETAPAKPL
ncbi:sulfate adenylyltransferase subunit 1 [Ottowia testudinis]|uniref:sulfate adenylyltransferase n=1 Tax=Ottowia testudinis TaxID=2816950 RepID=A0A975H7F3_9BURK|nr:GTP-binding protein [Ottowia testudinis]QTD46997.1 sulfate adenylyltransferase [Ottowia testudinis]